MRIKLQRLYMQVGYESRHLAKSITGSRWHPASEEWSFPVNYTTKVMSLFPSKRLEISNLYENYLAIEEKRKLEEKESKSSIESESKGFTFDVNDIELNEGLFSKDRQPFDHQRYMTKAALKNNSLGFFCEMGTGKTKAIIDTFKHRLYRGEAKRMIVLCPMSVMVSWKNDLIDNEIIDFALITGTKKQRMKLLEQRSMICIINYEGIVSLGDNEYWREFDVVAIDESSKIKSHEAQRTKLILSIFKDTKYRYLASGTPITQNPADAYTQLKFLDPKYVTKEGKSTPMSYYAFRNTYCVIGGFGGYQIVGTKNLHHLQNTLKKSSVQIKKVDCLDLPEKVYTQRHIDMPKALKDQYESMKKEFILELEDGKSIEAAIIVTKMMRMQQILSGCHLPNSKDNSKLKELMDIIDERKKCDDRVVVICKYRESIRMIAEALDKKKLSYGLIQGDVPVEQREKDIKDFQDGSKDVFILQQRAGGLGITLTRGSTMVFFENDYVFDERKQVEDRIHRIGQGKKCLYVDLLYKNSIEQSILGALSKKQNVAKYLVDSFTKGEYKLKKEKV